MSTGRETINCLQAARAVAALAVVLCHANAATGEVAAGTPGWLGWATGYGWLGVDFFFVLSGFIMAYSHRAMNRAGLEAYAWGRLARVLVPYAPVGIAVATLYTLVPPGGDSKWNWLASATLIPGSGAPALEVAWTLQFELVFYAVFGLSLVAGRPFAGVSLWVIAAVTCNLLFGEPAARFNPFLNPIVVEFLFGMAAAKLVFSQRIQRPLLAAGASFLAYVLVGGGTEARALFALAMAFLVVALVRAERSGALRVPGGLVFLGGASYAIYLVHSPLVALGAGLFDHWLLSLGGAVAVGVGAGVAYHLWREARCCAGSVSGGRSGSKGPRWRPSVAAPAVLSRSFIGSLTMRIAFVAALAVVSTVAIAQAPSAPPGSRNAAAVSGGNYSVDSAHTLVVWTLDHMGFSPYTGIFGDVTGSLTLDPKRPNAAKVDVSIPVSKVVTASAGLTQHLLRPGKNGGKPDFFGANPGEARFVSTAVVANGQKARIRGQLTLNGVTRPVMLDATFYGAGKMPAAMGGEENIGFRATGTIMRSQFGLTTGIPMVGDVVKLDISAAFKKAKS